jgi:hypothetical protein
VFGVAWGIVVFVVFGVAHSVPFGVASSVAVVIKNNLESGQSSLWSKLIFTFLILSYAALIWIYWLGGWRVLSGA